MDESEKIKIWLNYMVTQKSLIHFRPWIKVPPQRIQHWGKLNYPILEIEVGTNNHPKIQIIPYHDFTDEMFCYWIKIMENKSGLIKYDSSCNYSYYMENIINNNPKALNFIG